MTYTLILVEDTYGVGFHREILNRLGYHGCSIYRVPAWRCSAALRRKAVARALRLVGLKGRLDKVKLILVTDTEGKPVNFVREELLAHFKGAPFRKIIVIPVVPCHEAWLCICLGINPNKCRCDPINAIERSLKREYHKSDLEDLIRNRRVADVSRLLKERDFQEYLKALKDD